MDQTSIAVAKLEERVANLEDWQNKQNGYLSKLDEKIEKLGEELHKGYYSIQSWLIGVLGGIIVSLVVLILNLVKGKI